MKKAVITMVGVALMCGLLSGCAGDLSPSEQDALYENYRCTLQPLSSCRRW